MVGRADPDDPEIQTAFVLTSNGLQKWQLTLGEPDGLYYECDVSRLAENHPLSINKTVNLYLAWRGSVSGPRCGEGVTEAPPGSKPGWSISKSWTVNTW